MGRGQMHEFGGRRRRLPAPSVHEITAPRHEQSWPSIIATSLIDDRRRFGRLGKPHLALKMATGFDVVEAANMTFAVCLRVHSMLISSVSVPPQNGRWMSSFLLQRQRRKPA